MVDHPPDLDTIANDRQSLFLPLLHVLSEGETMQAAVRHNGERHVARVSSFFSVDDRLLIGPMSTPVISTEDCEIDESQCDIIGECKSCDEVRK